MNFHQKPTMFVEKVNLKVQNLERSANFYQEIIGFTVLKQTDTTIDLTADGKNVLLSLEQPKNVIPKERKTSGLYHFALLLPKRSELGRFFLHLLQNNYPIQGAADHFVSEAIYLADPDGNGIEIYADRPKETWSWKNGEVEMPTVAMDAEGLIKEANRTVWDKLPRETVMGHIHLHISDIKKAEEFYTKGLGLEVVSRYGEQAIFISDNKYHHHIGLNIWNGIGVPTPHTDSVGLKSFVLIIPDKEKRIEIANRLKNMGILVLEENDIFITTDPSGNRIELHV